MNKKKIKKFTSLSFALGIVATVPAVLSSCSISSSLLEEYVPKGTGLQLASGNGYSLTDLTKYSLSTNTGMEKWFKQLVNQSILQWYQKLGSDSSQSSDKAGYARKLSSEKESIDDSYDSTYKGTSASNGTEKNYLFQQKELDPNGGTIDSWKKQKWLDWASSNFESDLFANLYLSLVDSSGNWVKTTYDNLTNALKTSSESSSSTSGSISFKFNGNALKGTSSASKDTYVNNEYANFQQFIFNQWVQSENPFIINYDKWAYGTPSEGLDTIYNADAIGKTSTSTTAIAGSYAFPYFSNAADNSTYSDVNKFTQFVTTAKSSGIVDNNDTSGTYGLTNINKNNYSGDTSASYKLVTNATSYSDLNASLALGATYLFSTAYTDSSSFASATDLSGTTATASSTGVNYESRNKLSKASISTTSTGPFDVITSNFISSSQDTFKNGDLNSSSGASTVVTSSDSYITSTQLSNELVQKVLSKNAYSLLTSSTNTNKDSSSNPTLYSIDAFIPNETNLKNVLFLRDTDGVYAITLDGEKYISGAKNLSEAKTRAGNVVLYRYLESKMPSGAVSSTSGLSSIDLLSTLKTFYESNRDWLIFEYAQSKSSSGNENGQSLFDFSFITSNANAKNVLNDISAYYYILNRYQRLQSYQEAVYKVKSTYSSNYGTVANKNGLAAQFPYEFTDASSSTTTKAATASIGYYSQLSTLKIEQPSWWITSSSGASNSSSVDWNNPNSSSGIYSTLMAAIQSYVSSLSISPLTSSFAGFKYSQYIYTDDFFLNQAILAVGSDGNLLSDMIKENVLKTSINGNSSSIVSTSNSYIDASSYNVSNFNDTSASSDSTQTDVSKYINSALSNYFFNSTFDSSSNKWIGLQQSYNSSYSSTSDATKATVTAPSTLSTIKYDDLDTYRKNMWLSSNLTSTGTTNDNYVNFLTLIATIQYLNANDGAKFMEQLRNKISTTDGTNLAFLVWESSVDKNLDNSTSFATTASNSAAAMAADVNTSSSAFSDAKSLLYGSNGDSVVTNVDNSQATSYYPNKNNIGSYVDKNNNNSTFTDSSLTSNYYTHVSKMHGFQGIETSSSSSNISSELSEALFTSPSLFSTVKATDSSSGKATLSNSTGTGLLYGIASSRETLETIIKGYSSSQVDSLAQFIQKYYGVDVSSVLNADGSIITNDTTAKQQALITIVKDTSKVPQNAFTPRRGYVNNGTLYKEKNQSVTDVNYGSYVIQLSGDDLKDKTTFIKTLQSTFNSYDPSSTSTTTSTNTNSSANEEAASLYWNLLVQFATDSSIQDVALSNILTNNKINVFDVRLNNQLGSKWVINYKEQSSS